MRIANHAGRARIVSNRHTDEMIEPTDIARPSNSRFGPSPTNALELWESSRRRVQRFDIASDSTGIAREFVGIDPNPTQELAVEANCADHASENGQTDTRAIIANFPTQIVRHQPTVEAPTVPFDREVELVMVIERLRVRIGSPQVAEFLGGFMVGQDLSERESPSPLSAAAVPPLPEDLIFTGAPSGVGRGRDPQVFRAPGDHLSSTIENLGRIDQSFTATRNLR